MTKINLFHFRKTAIFIFVVSFLFILSAGLFRLLPLYINVTSSLPYGLYYKRNLNSVKKGDIILFCLKGDIAALAKKRGYISLGTCSCDLAPVGKKVVASSNDLISVSLQGISVNNQLLKNTAPQDKDVLGRPLPFNEIQRKLSCDEFIVASEKTDSFDSRYFGIVQKKDIQGILSPVFTF